MTGCGLYCGACSSMVAYDNGVAPSEAGNLPDDPCPGCGSPEMQDCEFLVCNKEHNVECCAFCSEFPCSMILKFKEDEWPHHIEVIDNLNRIREIGADAWLAEQKKVWSCPECGTRTHWYQTECIICNAKWEPKYKSWD